MPEHVKSVSSMSTNPVPRDLYAEICIATVCEGVKPTIEKVFMCVVGNCIKVDEQWYCRVLYCDRM